MRIQPWTDMCHFWFVCFPFTLTTKYFLILKSNPWTTCVCLCSSSGRFGWRSTVPALQGSGVYHQQHGVQWGGGSQTHWDPVRESRHHSGDLAHGTEHCTAQWAEMHLPWVFRCLVTECIGRIFNAAFYVYTRLFQATQKGDLVAVLKKQLEEREKQLAAEQEDAAAARNRQRELTKVCHPSVVKKPVWTLRQKWRRKEEAMLLSKLKGSSANANVCWH